MTKSLNDLCVKDDSLWRHIRKRASVLRRRYPSTFDREDAENYLWLRVFEAIDKKYDPSQDLIAFCHSAIRSSYGHLLPYRRKNLHLRGMERNPTFESAPYIDPGYQRVEAYASIESIRRDLLARQSEGRAYRVAVQALDSLMEGKTIADFSRENNIPQSTAYRAYNSIRSIAEAYA